MRHDALIRPVAVQRGSKQTLISSASFFALALVVGPINVVSLLRLVTECVHVAPDAIESCSGPPGQNEKKVTLPIQNLGFNERFRDYIPRETVDMRY